MTFGRAAKVKPSEIDSRPASVRGPSCFTLEASIRASNIQDAFSRLHAAEPLVLRYEDQSISEGSLSGLSDVASAVEKESCTVHSRSELVQISPCRE